MLIASARGGYPASMTLESWDDPETGEAEEDDDADLDAEDSDAEDESP